MRSMVQLVHAMFRLIGCASAGRQGLAHEVSEALEAETRMPIATRLRLVALATRLEAGDRCGLRCIARPPFEGVPANRAEPVDDTQALAAIAAAAPELRAMADDLARRGDPCSLAPAALLELLRLRMH